MKSKGCFDSGRYVRTYENSEIEVFSSVIAIAESAANENGEN